MKVEERTSARDSHRLSRCTAQESSSVRIARAYVSIVCWHRSRGTWQDKDGQCVMGGTQVQG